MQHVMIGVHINTQDLSVNGEGKNKTVLSENTETY